MSADTRPGPQPPAGTATPSIRRIDKLAPFTWLRLGWGEFRSAPVAAMLYGLLFANISAVVLWSTHAWPGLTLSFATGLLLVSQFLALGLYAGARQHANGETISIPGAMRLLSRRAVNLGLLALALGLIMLLWVRMSSVLFAIQYASFEPSIEAYLQLLSGEAGDGAVAAYFVLIGFVLAVLVFVSSCIAAPMIVDRDCGPVEAMLTSARACLANPLPMALWALLIVSISVIGIVPFFVGMWVLFPVLGYASWHSYKALVE